MTLSDFQNSAEIDICVWRHARLNNYLNNMYHTSWKEPERKPASLLKVTAQTLQPKSQFAHHGAVIPFRSGQWDFRQITVHSVWSLLSTYIKTWLYFKFCLQNVLLPIVFYKIGQYTWTHVQLITKCQKKFERPN